MKKLGVFAVAVMVLTGCEDVVHQKYFMYEPVYTDSVSFRKPAIFGSAKSIDEVGQIYYYNNILFVVENDFGIHFIDNSNPESPNNVGFLEVTGCTGLSIRGNNMYVNSFVDLIVFDISNMNNPVEINRFKDVFPYAMPVMDHNYPIATIDKNLGVVTSWNIVEKKEKVEDNVVVWNNCWNCFQEDFMTINFEASSGTASTSSGTAGSITKFTIVNNHLYVMDGFSIHPFNISNPAAPTASVPVGVWGNVETLFPYEDYIFMGTPTGMLIYGTENPDYPTFISQLSHARGCDPVVVQNDYAYVTVRSGGPCGGGVDQLDVIDISNISSPVLVGEFELKNPHGLGISGNRLFVCDGKSGLKVFDATNPVNCGDNLLETFENVQATDVIPVNGLLMMIGEDGIYQYDYSDETEVELLSKIKF